MSILRYISKLHLSIRLVLLYWVFIGLVFFTALTPLGKNSGGFELLFLAMLPALPGYLVLNLVEPLMSSSYVKWMTTTENLTQVTFIGYAITSILIILIGILFSHHYLQKVNLVTKPK
jgi:hypothetical protein